MSVGLGAGGMRSSRISTVFLFALAALVTAGLAACSRPAHFSTSLDTANGLAGGNPVTYQGARIGHVTAVTPEPRGSEVQFDVGHANANDVHQDSIVVLQSGGESPSLDLRTPNPLSPIAPSGSFIRGASSEAEARVILASRGLGALVGGLARFLGSLHAGGATSTPSPALDALLREMNALEQNIRANASANQAAARAQIERLTREADRFEQELIRQGRSAEAKRLQREIARLVGSLTPPPSKGKNTLITPKVYPSH